MAFKKFQGKRIIRFPSLSIRSVVLEKFPKDIIVGENPLSTSLS